MPSSLRFLIRCIRFSYEEWLGKRAINHHDETFHREEPRIILLLQVWQRFKLSHFFLKFVLHFVIVLFILLKLLVLNLLFQLNPSQLFVHLFLFFEHLFWFLHLQFFGHFELIITSSFYDFFFFIDALLRWWLQLGNFLSVFFIGLVFLFHATVLFLLLLGQFLGFLFLLELQFYVFSQLFVISFDFVGQHRRGSQEDAMEPHSFIDVISTAPSIL